jgi:hypothetical protein
VQEVIVPTPEETIRLYAQLAEEHQKRDRPQERDRFLLLAADAALTAGKRDVAENFRKTLLTRNPNHLLKPYASLGEALESPDIATYVQELRRTYPPERVQRGTKMGGTALGSGKEGEEEEFILPLDYERTKVKPNFTFNLEPATPPRSGGQAMAKPNDPFPNARQPAPANQPPQPLPATPAGPNVFALRPEPSPAQPRLLPQRPRTEPAASGGWMGSFLFFVTLMAAAALFGWVFVRPFVTPR